MAAGEDQKASRISPSFNSTINRYGLLYFEFFVRFIVALVFVGIYWQWERTKRPPAEVNRSIQQSSATVCCCLRSLFGSLLFWFSAALLGVGEDQKASHVSPNEITINHIEFCFQFFCLICWLLRLLRSSAFCGSGRGPKGLPHKSKLLNNQPRRVFFCLFFFCLFGWLLRSSRLSAFLGSGRGLIWAFIFFSSFVRFDDDCFCHCRH